MPLMNSRENRILPWGVGGLVLVLIAIAAAARGQVYITAVSER
jgi:hypothetical protein